MNFFITVLLKYQQRYQTKHSGGPEHLAELPQEDLTPEETSPLATLLVKRTLHLFSQSRKSL